MRCITTSETTASPDNPNTRIMPSQPSIRNEDDTNDWVAMIRESDGLFDKEILRRHYNIYGMQSDTPFTSPAKVRGLPQWFETHMRVLRMKTSNATSNAIRYKWLCQHYFIEERINANPNNYHVFPFTTFWGNTKFYAHFLMKPLNVLDKPIVRFIFAIFLMLKMHTWSHRLYMIPLPMLKMAYPCAEVPTQHFCEALNFVQRNTFDGIQDMNKTIMTAFVSWFVSLMTSLLATRRGG